MRLRLYPGILVVLGFSALCKFIYVFAGTAYDHYLYEDAKHYFGRAMAFYEGQLPYHRDWDVFPMGSSVGLWLWWKGLSLFGLNSHFLESALVLNILATTTCTALMAHLSWRLTQSTRITLLVAMAYGLYFPLVYLNAFVISEHASQLFFLAGLSCLVESGKSTKPLIWHAVAGACWALACQFHGAYLLSLLPALAFLAFRPSAQPQRLASVTCYIVSGLLIFALASLTLWVITDGEAARPAGNNGGYNFFMQQCHFQGAVSVQEHFTWYFTPATFIHQPELGIYYTPVPIPEQGFYYREGLRCLERLPGAWSRLIALFPSLLYSQFFPDVDTALGYHELMPWVRHINTLMTLLAPAGWWALRRHHRAESDLLLWSLVSLWTTFALFNHDHRHFYSMMCPLMLLAGAGIAQLWRASWSWTVSYCLGANAFLLLCIYLFAGKGPWSLYDHKPITIPASLINRQVPDGTPWYALESLRFWAPVTIDLGTTSHAQVLQISLDSNDSYEISFWQGKRQLGRVLLSLAQKSQPFTGLIRRNVRIPAAIVESGYDHLLVTARAGDDHYSMAGLCLLPTPESTCSATPP